MPLTAPSKKRKAIRPGETAPRSHDGPTQGFEVVSAAVWGMDGKKKRKGETVYLNEDLARFYADRNKIRVPLKFEEFVDDTVAAPVTEPATGSEDDGDGATEAVAEAVADTDGSELRGGTEQAVPHEADGDGAPKRERRSRKAL